MVSSAATVLANRRSSRSSPGFHAPEPGGRCACLDANLPLPIAAERAQVSGPRLRPSASRPYPDAVADRKSPNTQTRQRADWRISWRREHDAVGRSSRRYGLSLDPRAAVALSFFRRAGDVRDRAGRRGSRVRRAASRGRLLVLDEPTPFLPRVGVDQLFALVRQIVADGASVIFVSHDVAEVMEITDRATVLRDGDVVGTLETRGRRRTSLRREDRRPLGGAVSCSRAHRRQARPAARIDGLLRRGSDRFRSRSARARSSGWRA